MAIDTKITSEMVEERQRKEQERIQERIDYEASFFGRLRVISKSADLPRDGSSTVYSVTFEAMWDEEGEWDPLCVNVTRDRFEKVKVGDILLLGFPTAKENPGEPSFHGLHFD